MTLLGACGDGSSAVAVDGCVSGFDGIVVAVVVVVVVVVAAEVITGRGLV